ncbi:hypothetical protein MMC22_001377, partial [Lobaria immixta]|nr:hypothetical protein [Lobaria immixta]
MERRLLDLSPTSSTSNTTRNTSVNRTQSRRQKLQKWRVSVLLCTLTALFTFLVNLALAIWASSKGLKGGIATIQSGDCDTTKRLDLWLHLGINLLSTMLLGASNYTMQCLSSPTRDEIDKAHRQRIIVDIGIPSIRNLKRVSWSKIVLWWLIALSSIPLHLLYNSAVFSSISTPSYLVAVVSPDILNGAPFGASFMDPTAYRNNSEQIVYRNHTTIDDRTGAYGNGVLTDYDVQRIQKLRDSQSIHRLDNDACLKAYKEDFTADRRDVLVVSSGHRMNDSLLSVAYSVPATGLPYGSPSQSISYTWTCCIRNCSGGSLDRTIVGSAFPQKACPFPDHNWTIDGHSIEYCLNESIPQSCTLQFSLVIMIIVISCNLLKTVCMGLTVWSLSSMPLLTLGDAIASFLAEADPNTKNNCLAEKFSFRGSNYAGSDAAILSKNGPDISTLENLINDKGKSVRPGWDEGIRRWKPERYTWFNAPSKKRWFLSFTL